MTAPPPFTAVVLLVLLLVVLGVLAGATPRVFTIGMD